MRMLWIAVAIVLLSASCGLIVERDPDEPPPGSAPAASAVRALRDDTASLSPEEIHTIHAPLGIPAGSPPSNDLIFRHSYTASTNDETRFADWVAYSVTPEWLEDLHEPERDYRTDPVLSSDETLEERSGAGDYDGAHAAHGYDRGHLVPLGSFHGSPFAAEVNFVSVLAPQVDRLNRGPWRSLENRVRRLVAGGGPVYVLAGPVYDGGEPMPDLPGADEPHTVPTAFWMIVYTDGHTRAPASAANSGEPTEPADAGVRVSAFIVPQRLPVYDGPQDFITTVDEIESVTGLDFLSLLDDGTEDGVESTGGGAWFATW